MCRSLDGDDLVHSYIEITVRVVITVSTSFAALFVSAAAAASGDVGVE